tara:strand:+ start:83 stop:1411 length:1329 start_codon:yes stop_codon:yes gene_type:complete
MRTIITCTLLAALLPVTSFSMTLEDSLSRAYLNHPSLKASISNLEATNENLTQARAGWMPTIEGSVERGKQRSEVGSNTSHRLTDTRNTRITQPLFQGGRTIALSDKAHADIETARANLTQTEQDLLLDAVIAYLNLVRDQQVLKLSQKNEVIMGQHLDITNERFSVGEVTQTDVAQAKANLAQATSEKVRSTGNLRISQASFEQVVGVKAPELKKIPNLPSLPSLQLSSLIDHALFYHPLIKAADQQLSSAKEQIWVEKSSLLPSVNMVASTQEQEGSIFLSGTSTTDSITVNVSVPLYQSGAEYSRIRQAKRRAASQEFNLEAVQRQVTEGVINAHQNVIVTGSIITSRLAAVDAFNLALEGTKAESKAGQRTTLDVLEAQQDVFAAQVELVKAKRDEVVSHYQLLAAIGQLTAQNLNLNVTPYDVEKHYDQVKYKVVGF